MKKLKTCSIEGCDRPYRSNGYCNAHRLRWQRYGDPQADRPVAQALKYSAPYNIRPTPHDQLTFTIKPEEVSRFRQLADRIVSLNMHAAARYRAQNARDDAAEHATAAA